MNDRFKFRFWHKPTNKMIDCYGFNEDFVFGDTLDGVGTVYNPAKFKDCILMQSTGLKDKNGKLIYEGDIVTVACGHFVIKYCDVCKSFQCFCDDECFACNGDYHWFEFLDDEREIIGNIHENPDFLEW